MSEVIQRLKQGHNLEDIKSSLQLYVPAIGSTDISLVRKKFDLDTEIQRFVENKDYEQGVLLLTGDSGSGKSTYLRFLFQRLWITSHQDYIPILINLSAYKAISTVSLIQRVFQQQSELTPEEITHLKKNNRFLFLLDGFDELPGEKHKIEGYLQPILDEWKCKIIVTLRSHVLKGNYSSFFKPRKTTRSVSFLEVNVESMDASQIETFLKQYTSSVSIEWREYKDNLSLISKSIYTTVCSTPLLLRMVLDILPNLTTPLEFRRDLYEEFMNYYFIKQEIRLWKDVRYPLLKGVDNIKGEFKQFCLTLAATMFLEGVSVITYPDARAKASPWDLFFDEKDTLMTICREYAPLIRVGPHEWTFIHHSFLEYFLAESVMTNDFKTVQVSPVEQDVSQWGVGEVQKWFEKDVKLAMYSQLIREESVTGPLLLVLDDESLRDLGISKKIHRQRIVNQIHKWNSQNSK